MELNKAMEIRFSNLFHNIVKILSYYGRGAIFPVEDPLVLKAWALRLKCMKANQPVRCWSQFDDKNVINRNLKSCIPILYVRIVQYDDSEADMPTNWRELESDNPDPLHSPGLVLVEPNSCHIMVNHFTNFGIVGEPCGEKPACKRIKILVYFTTPLTEKSDCHLRAYCVADTKAAVQVSTFTAAIMYCHMLFFLLSL